jgi:hypothetical protein
MEAIRISLAANNGSDFAKACVAPYTSAQCVLGWRQNAKKQIIMATDEDSDLPTLSRYRVLNQANNGLCPQLYSSTARCGTTSFEPPFQSRIYDSNARQFFRNTSAPLRLDAAYMEEIAITSRTLIQNAATLSLLVKSDFNANRNGPISNYDSTSSWFNKFAPNKSDINTFHTTIVQYGDPLSQAQDNITFGNFSITDTLGILNERGLSQSLQAQVLSQGGLMRLFRIQDIVDTNRGAYVLQNIYTALAVQVQQCAIVYVPDTVGI